MQEDPRKDDVRREMRARRLGYEPVCVRCGETDPVAFHHVAGRANDPDLEAPLCFNCHARSHEALREVGAHLERDRSRTKLERLGIVLRALASFFLLLAESLHGWATQVSAIVQALDRHVPGWRSLEESY